MKAMCDQFTQVTEFQSMRDGQRFDVTGKKDAAGRFVLDDDFTFVGPFIVFERDGLPARFIGLRDRRVLLEVSE
jgi:hypothetical protein